jgi:hypothetical protein
MVTKEFKFQNGDKVKETVTGFTGTITGTSFYLTGCNQYLVVPKCKDEFTKAEGIWYDEGRLELVTEQKVTEEQVKAKDNGCDIAPLVGKRGN